MKNKQQNDKLELKMLVKNKNANNVIRSQSCGNESEDGRYEDENFEVEDELVGQDDVSSEGSQVYTMSRQMSSTI